MGLLVTMAVSGTSSSAPVEHGNFQKPFGRYIPVDCGMALGVLSIGGRKVGVKWIVFPEIPRHIFRDQNLRGFLRGTCRQEASAQIWSHPLGSSSAPVGSLGSCLLRWEGAAVQSATS
jgi:hypothetical protein